MKNAAELLNLSLKRRQHPKIMIFQQ